MLRNQYFRKYHFTSFSQKTIHFWDKKLNRTLTIDIYAPQTRLRNKNIPIILFNDGQDVPKVKTIETFRKLYHNRKIKPAIIVGIHSNANRNHELGTTQYLEASGHGKDALAYQNFITQQLIPFLKGQYGSTSPMHMAGFSLGGLSALDIVINNPDVFDSVGIFSGALWWRNMPYFAKYPNASLIIPKKIKALKGCPPQKFWFQTGTLDETNDRDNNGVIDSIDDSLHVIRALQQKGVPKKNIKYVEVKGGKHEYATWQKAMSDFLICCMGQ